MPDPLLLDLPMSLSTPRLDLRVPRAGDGEALHAAIVETLGELRRFLASLPWVAGEHSVESAEIFCRNAHANFLARKDFPFLMFDRATGELVGVVGLHRPEWRTPKVEIGYWRRTGAARQGFAREAVEALTAYAFGKMNAVRVELVTDEENRASRRVAESCAFRLEGTLRHERRALDGSLRNTCIYARYRETRRAGS